MSLIKVIWKAKFFFCLIHSFRGASQHNQTQYTVLYFWKSEDKKSKSV